MKISAAAVRATLATTDKIPLEAVGSTIAYYATGQVICDGVKANLAAVDKNFQVGVAGTAATITLTADHATVPWKIKSYSSTFSGVRDDVLNIGFNVFNQDDLTRAGMGWQMESDFYSGGVHASEFILAWNAPTTGAGLRPLQINVNYDATMQHLIRGSVYYYNDNPVGSSYLTMIDGVITPDLTTHLLGANNVCYLRQKNSSGATKNLIYLDASSVTQIASDGGGAKVTGNSQLDGTLRVLKTGGYNVLELSGTTLATYQFGLYISAGTPDYLYLYTGNFPMTWTSTGLVGVNTHTPTTYLDIAGDMIRIRTAKTPATHHAAGNVGDICWDTTFLYICVATNVWRKVELNEW